MAGAVVLGGGLLVVFQVLVQGDPAGAALVNTSATALTLLMIRRHRPVQPGAWRALAATTGLFTVSNLGWFAGFVGAGTAAGAVEQGAKLAAAGALGVFVVLLVRARSRPRSGADLTLLVLGAAVLVAQWTVLARQVGAVNPVEPLPSF